MGSMLNKLIIIPLILIISAIAPWLMKPILILGGLYLAYEGVESVLEKFFGHHEAQSQKETLEELSTEHFETNKVKSAIKTDFILSLEIMVLALSFVSNTTMVIKLATLVAVGIVTTVGVYGVVALIIKLDDIGFFLQARTNGMINKIGDVLVAAVPYLIKAISVIGTVAMLAVGGGIVAHQTGLLHGIEEIVHHYISVMDWLVMFAIEIVFGMIIGYIVVKLVSIAIFTKSKFKKIV
jgi:predicted DNA repair protein MutK